MKQKIKLYSLFITILMVIFTFSCSQDDFLMEETNTSQQIGDFKLEEISFTSLKNNPKVLQKIKEINSFKGSSSGSNYRTIYNEQYAVFIDTTRIVMIEEEGLQTITMKIVSEENNNNKIENLILRSKENGDYSAYIAEYILSEQELLAISNGTELTGKVPKSLTELGNNYQTMSFISGTGNGTDCLFLFTYTVMKCRDKNGNYITFTGDVDGRCVGLPIEETYTVLSLSLGCLSGGDGGTNPGNGNTNPGNGGTNPGSGGGSGNGNTNPGSGNTNPNNPQDPDFGLVYGGNNPIRTLPILVDPSTNHIDELNKITNQNSSIRTEINYYRDNLDYFFEEGKEFNMNGSSFPAQNLVYNGVKFFDIDIFVFNPVTRLHKHHDELYPVFSVEDILGMVDFFMEKQAFDSNNANNITSIMVSKTGVHAFRVSNITDAQEFSGIYPTDDAKKLFKGAYKNKVIIESMKGCNCTSGVAFDNLLFDNFIKFFKSFVWGFDYYYAPHPTTNIDTSNYVWTKKS